MGQKPSSECNCQDGFWQFCAPQDPKNDETGQYTATAAPAYSTPNVPVAVGQTSDFSPDRGLQATQQRFDFGDDQTYFGAPPPEDNIIGGAPPPPTSSGGSPVNRPPPAAAAAAPLSSSPARGRSISADDILSNLEASEEELYGAAYTRFPGAATGVGLDCAEMRDFICTNSAISMEDIDLELLKVASPEEGLTRAGFIGLLREFAVTDGQGIEAFIGLSADGESVAAEECRNGLLIFAQQKLNTNFSPDRWECIFNVVMWDAGVTVPMEQWLGYTKTTARLVRCLRFAQV